MDCMSQNLHFGIGVVGKLCTHFKRGDLSGDIDSLIVLNVAVSMYLKGVNKRNGGVST